MRNRGGPPPTLVHEAKGLHLIKLLFPQVIEFDGDAVLSLMEAGLYRKQR